MLDGFGAARTQREVVFVTATLVAVPLDFCRKVFVRFEESRLRFQYGLEMLFDDRFV